MLQAELQVVNISRLIMDQEILKKATYEIKVLKQSVRQTAIKYGFKRSTLRYHLDLPENHSEMSNKTFLRKGEQLILMRYLKALVDCGRSVTPQDITDKAHKIRQSRLGVKINKPTVSWLYKFLKKNRLSTQKQRGSPKEVSKDDIIAWFAQDDKETDSPLDHPLLVEALLHSKFSSDEFEDAEEESNDDLDEQDEDYKAQQMEDDEQDKELINHKIKCRLCIDETEENSQIEITEEVRSLILELQLELIFTRSYSNFICENCHQNIQQLSSFRRLVNEKQQKLSQFLCSIKSENSEPYVNFKSFDDPLDMETVVVKVEPLDDEIPVEKTFQTTKCAFCNKRFASPDSLQIHIQFAHNVKEISEEADLEDLFNIPDPENSSNASENHQEVVENQKMTWDDFIEKVAPVVQDPKDRLTAQCSICGKVISTSSMFHHMQMVHYKTKRFSCDICGKQYYKKDHMRDHVTNHVPKEFRENKFHCDLCSKSYHTSMNLRKHMKNIHHGRPIECECGKSFESYTSFYGHRRYVHKKEELPCEQCRKVFINSFELRKHLKIFHTEGGRGNFVCPECGKRFDEIRTLNKHRKMHGEKTISCDQPGCDAKFSTNHQMKAHKENIHFNIKNFKCDREGCGKAFSSKQKWLRHTKVVHDKLKANCPVEGCKFMVGIREYMKRHLRKHTEVDREELQKMIEDVPNTVNLW